MSNIILLLKSQCLIYMVKYHQIDCGLCEYSHVSFLFLTVNPIELFVFNLLIYNILYIIYLFDILYMIYYMYCILLARN